MVWLVRAVAALVLTATAASTAGAAQRDPATASDAFELDYQKIVEYATPMATQALKTDNFIPFGVEMDGKGAMTIVLFDPRQGGQDESDSYAIVDMGHRVLRAAAAEKKLRAVAIIYDGRIRRGDGSIEYPDAITMVIDHRGSQSAMIFALPYKVARAPGKDGVVTLIPDAQSAPGNHFAY